MYSLGWVGVKLPDIFRYALHSDSVPPQGANRGRFKSPVVDSLIEQAEVITDLGSQAALYRELQSELLRELPYVPLWYEDNVLVAQSRIQGYVLAADGNYDGLIHTDRRE
jgi:peptide/nickel transport system substrate-binding protein